MKKKSCFRLAKIVLFMGGIAWCLPVVALLMPWDCLMVLVSKVMNVSIENSLLLRYWSTLAIATFFMVGLLHFALFFKTKKYVNLLPLLGWWSILTGLFLGFYGTYLKLSTRWYWADFSFCFLVGLILIASSYELRKKTKKRNKK